MNDTRSGKKRSKAALLAILVGIPWLVQCRGIPQAEPQRMNFLLITADDLEWTSVGVYGSTVDNITPNIDKLASEGIRFTNGHVTIAVCQPSRQTLMSGKLEETCVESTAIESPLARSRTSCAMAGE